MNGKLRVPVFLRSPLLILAAAGASVCLASNGQVSTSPLPLRSLGHVSWTAADFDGDNQLDVATTRSSRGGYLLELDLSTRRGGASGGQFTFPSLPPSAFGLHLTPRDVDGDHDLDIIITSGFARQPVAVWINDGKGGFAEGDLAAYPSWIWREDHSFSAQNRQQTAPWIFAPNRNSGSDLEPGADSFGVAPTSKRLTSLRPGSPALSSTADYQPARAPPLSLFA